MSDKLPVGGVVNEAVMFGLHRWTTYARFFWAPLLLITVLVVAFIILAFDFSALNGIEENDPDALGALIDSLRMPPALLIPLGMAFGLGALFIAAGPSASIYRLIILGENRPGLIHLRFDGPAVRVFLAMIVMALINFLIWGVALLIADIMSDKSIMDGFRAFGDLLTLVAESEEGDIDPDRALSVMGEMSVPTTAFLLTIIPSIYCNIKLAPFVPGSAAENRLILLKAFRMTFGSAWSIFGAFVLFMIFLVIAGLILGIALEVLGLIATFITGKGGALAFLGAIFMVAITLIELFFNIFSNAAQMALTAIIYRRLETGE